MTLGRPPQKYDPAYESERNRSIERADSLSLKRDSDVYLVNGIRLILQSPDGTRYALTVDNAGVLGTEAV